MRSDYIKQYLGQGVFAVCPRFMENIVDVVNSGDIAKETITEVTPAHSYSKEKNIAIITVDGAMSKRNTWMNAMCGGFASYDIIGEYIDKAEKDSDIDTILFSIDTPGGEVAGVDEIGEKIFNSTKKTITHYSNLGASAGIWAFSASKEIYASETTLIGSIGVISGYYKESQNENKVVMVSKNAKNKNCSLNGNCEEKIQSRIDKIEDIFYSRVVRNTNLTKEEISSRFNFGDVVSAEEAKEIGFLKDVISFDALKKTLVVGTVPAKSKPVNSNFKEKSMAGNENPEQVDLVAAERERTKQIASLGMMYGVAAEAVAEAIASGTDLSAFKDVCLEAQSNKFKATQEESAKKIEDLESRLNASIDAQATDGNATVEPTEPVQANKADEKNEKIIAAAEMTEV